MIKNEKKKELGEKCLKWNLKDFLAKNKFFWNFFEVYLIIYFGSKYLKNDKKDLNRKK